MRAALHGRGPAYAQHLQASGVPHQQSLPSQVHMSFGNNSSNSSTWRCSHQILHQSKFRAVRRVYAIAGVLKTANPPDKQADGFPGLAICPYTASHHTHTCQHAFVKRPVLMHDDAPLPCCAVSSIRPCRRTRWHHFSGSPITIASVEAMTTSLCPPSTVSKRPPASDPALPSTQKVELPARSRGDP